MKNNNRAEWTDFLSAFYFYMVFWSEKLSLLWYITLQLAVVEEPRDSSPVEKALRVPSLQGQVGWGPVQSALVGGVPAYPHGWHHSGSGVLSPLDAKLCLYVAGYTKMGQGTWGCFTKICALRFPWFNSPICKVEAILHLQQRTYKSQCLCMQFWRSRN